MITISENRASIERFDSLLTVNETQMIFLLPERRLTIQGEHLRVALFTKEEIWIEGMIRQVKFDER